MPRILYITDPVAHLRASGCLNNYLNDLLFHGLTDLFGAQVASSRVITPLYRSLQHTVDPRQLWGRGFTASWLLDGEPTVEQDVAGKLADRAYDLVIYGSFRDCDDHFELVSRAYPPDRVLLVDGNDDQGIDQRFERHPYFKRELIHRHPKLLPISFAVPAEKLCTGPNIDKTRTFATCFPGHPETYVFDTEDAYYADYRGALFAFTMRKHGWDCLRHYEILANRCLPLFFDLESCPPTTMTNYPRSLCQEANALFVRFNTERYLQLERALFDYTCSRLTTRALASYVVSKAS